MKTALIALIFFLLGSGITYSITQFQRIQMENQELKTKMQVSPTVSLSPTETAIQPSPLKDISGEQQDEKGTIAGTLGYPSDFIPPLEVYAMSTSDKKMFYKIDTAKNQQGFEITNIESGTYHVIAYTKDNGLSGAYTKAVSCGLSVECTDHSMISVTVQSGEVTKGIEVKDWYAPEGAFPSKP